LKRRLKESVDGSEFVAKLDKLEEATAERMAAQTYGNTEAFISAQARERLLREQLLETVLTSKARKNLPSSAFVFPERKGYPIHDRAHGANALARASGKPEWSKVKKAVCAKYPDLPACQSGSEKVSEAVLTAEARKKLSKSDFVFPEKAPGSGSYPIHDRRHGANALSRSSGKPEHAKVKAAVCARYPDLPECQSD
jgi:DNA-binding TFAR19-related protein (PDSD5 family)